LQEEDVKERWERCRREMCRCNKKMQIYEDVEDDVEERCER
jgi:hypothetical protein